MMDLNGISLLNFNESYGQVYTPTSKNSQTNRLLLYSFEHD